MRLWVKPWGQIWLYIELNPLSFFQKWTSVRNFVVLWLLLKIFRYSPDCSYDRRYGSRLLSNQLFWPELDVFDFGLRYCEVVQEWQAWKGQEIQNTITELRKLRKVQTWKILFLWGVGVQEMRVQIVQKVGPLFSVLDNLLIQSRVLRFIPLPVPKDPIAKVCKDLAGPVLLEWVTQMEVFDMN